MAIYMVQAGDDGPVKTGFGTNAKKRVASLQTSVPHKLTILRMIEGDQAFEKNLHRHFAPFRIRGEWFTRCDEMLGDLEQLRVIVPVAPQAPVQLQIKRYPTDPLTPAQFEELCREMRISVAEMCRRAGMAQSIFAKWKRGRTIPTLKNYARMWDVVKPKSDEETVPLTKAA